MSLWDGIFGRRRVKLSLADPAGWLLEGTSAAGKSVTQQSALRLSTAWACVRILSETGGTLPVGLYETAKDGTRVTRKDHPLYRILHDSPNADMTAAEFWEAMIACLCLWGNAYAEILRRGDGAIVALSFLRPDQMQVARKAGRRVYTYTDPGQANGLRQLDEDKVFHVRGFGTGGDLGLSPIGYARESMGAALAADEAAAKLLANGLQQPLIIDSGKAKLDRDQRKQLTEIFQKFAGSSNAGKTLVLESGMKPVSLSFKPDEAQFLETRAFSVEDICRWFRVPPFMVGHTDKTTAWGSGLEQMTIGFLTYALNPLLVRIAQAARKQLLRPDEREALYVEHVIDGLLRADSAARGELYKTLFGLGVLSPNQIADKENLPRFDGGDRRFVSVQATPLESASDPAAQARNALTAWLNPAGDA